MLKLGLTGSIATGKSTVLAAFATRGVPVFSSDEAVHELYAGEAAAAVGAAFHGVLRNGAVDRQALGAALVAAPERIAELEAIVHPMVRRHIADFLAQAQRNGAELAVVDIPLLFEGGHNYGFDRVLVTTVDDAILHRRALARPGMSVEKLETILARQLPQAEKQRRADYILDTSGSVESTEAAVAELVERLQKDAGKV